MFSPTGPAYPVLQILSRGPVTHPPNTPSVFYLQVFLVSGPAPIVSSPKTSHLLCLPLAPSARAVLERW